MVEEVSGRPDVNARSLAAPVYSTPRREDIKGGLDARIRLNAGCFCPPPSLDPTDRNYSPLDTCCDIYPLNTYAAALALAKEHRINHGRGGGHLDNCTAELWQNLRSKSEIGVNYLIFPPSYISRINIGTG